MSFPTYRQDFEAGTTLGTACPELIDQDSIYTIDSSGLHALTGNNSLKLPGVVSNHTIASSGADTLSGDVTLTAYIQNSATNVSIFTYARWAPPGVSGTSYLRMGFGPGTGISIAQVIAGVLTTLNTPISGVTMLTGVWLCVELRCHGTAVTARVVRQDSGQFFVNTGSGSWSPTPQVQSGTTTLTPAAGGWTLRLGDNSGLYVDDLIIEPAVPAIDHPTFTLIGAGATQLLTAGGFTDPIFGVTWSSSDTGVATVSSSGEVTAVGAGTATITATGKRDSGQTATAVATITTAAATTYTFTGPSPLSGYANNRTGLFTVTPDGPYTGTITITPSAGFGLTAASQTWAGTSTPWIFALTPTAPGPATLRPTNSGSLTDPAALVYTVLPQTLSIGPLSLITATPITATFTGVGTLWQSFPPSFTLSGTALAGASIGAATVLSDTSATALVTPGPTAGTLTFTDSTTDATASTAVDAPIVRTTWSYLGSATGFSAGLLGSVGYTVLRGDGSVYAARSTAGIFTVGTVGYAAQIAIPLSGIYVILWDNGSGGQTFEAVIPRGVEPTSPELPGGLNENQALAAIYSVLAGRVAGFVPGSGGHPIFLAPDGTTPRVAGDVDVAGNRTNLVLTPPQ